MRITHHSKRTYQTCIFAFLLMAALLALAGCGDSGTDSADTTQRGDDDDSGPTIPDVDDDSSSDDDLGDDDDDSDDDSGDDDSGDDDTTGAASVRLFVNPDPSDPTVDYYPGAVFSYIVGLLDDDGNYIGPASDYQLVANPNWNGVTHDETAQTLLFDRTGTWKIHAEVGSGGDLITADVTFKIVEIKQADIVFFTPDRGTFITRDANPGGSVNVTGECTVEGNPCDSVKINGQAPDSYNDLNGEFGTVFGLEDGLNTVVAEGFDSQNDSLGDANLSVLYGDYLADDQVASDAVGVRVTNQGMATISDLAEDLLASLNLMDYLPGPSNPDCPTDPSQCHLYNDYSCTWGICTGATADITSISYDPVQVDITATATGLNIQAEITNLDIATHADFELIGIPGSVTGNIRADSLYVWIMANIVVNPDGTLAVNITEFNPSISNLRFDNFGILGDILSLFTGAITPIIEGILPDLVVPELNDALVGILSDLDLSTDFEILSKSFYLGAKFSEVSVDTWGLMLWMDAQMTADTLDPTVPDLPGSWRKAGPRPLIQSTYPGIGAFDFGVLLDDDIVNQVLYEIFRSGALNYDLADDSLTTLILSPFFPQLLLINPNAPVIIRLAPMLPPILNVQSATDELATQIQLGDYLVSLIVDDPDDGEVEALTAALSLSLPASIDVDADGAILLDIDDQNYVFSVTIIDEAYNFNDALLEDFIPTLVDYLLPVLSNLLGAIEIPSISGYTLDVNGIEAVGTDEDYIGLFGSLVSAP